MAVRMGMVGLGNASVHILEAIARTPGFPIAAAVDTRPEARAAFEKAHDAPAFDSVAGMCRAGVVDAVWIATPNEFHCEHALAAAENGAHVICEKPMALSLAECDRMIAATSRAGVQLVQESKVFNPPVRAMRDVVASGRLGRVVQVNAVNFNDWMQRPRLAAEYDTERGGGLVFRQGPHHVDIVRYVIGAPAVSVRAVAGRWDPGFGSEGNYSALIQFDGGVAASLSYNAYGYFDSSELTWGIGEGGGQVSDADLRRPRQRRAGPLAPDEKYAPSSKRVRPPVTHPPFFGLTVVSCERGAIRQSPRGLYVYTEAGCEEMEVSAQSGGSPELLELKRALDERRPAFPGGSWGRDTLAVCLAILESSREQREIFLA